MKKIENSSNINSHFQEIFDLFNKKAAASVAINRVADKDAYERKVNKDKENKNKEIINYTDEL